MNRNFRCTSIRQTHFFYNYSPHILITMFRIRPMIKRAVPVVAMTGVMTFKVAACEDIFHSLIEEHFHWKLPQFTANLIAGNFYIHAVVIGK